MTTPEPFLRWAGGKRQLLATLLPALPADFRLGHHRFFEPFVGGGAVMFALAGHPSAAGLKASGRKKGRPVVINDANDELANTYQVLQNDVEALIAALGVLGQDTSADAYYTVRAATPTDPVDRAARTVYLNRLSFNGLYRVNSNGHFNVPYGQLAKPQVCDVDLLRSCASWLRNVEVRSGSYAAALADARDGDVVYLDPPYIPLTPTASFSKYAKDDFLELDQWGLAGVIQGLVARGARVLLSNSNTPLTRRIYAPVVELHAVSAARSIGASAASRGRVEEVLGLSYPVTACTEPAVVDCLAPAGRTFWSDADVPPWVTHSAELRGL